MSEQAAGTEPMVNLPLGTVLQFAAEREHAGRLDEAEALLERALRIAPESPDALHVMGVVSFRKGQPDRALELMEKSLVRGRSRPHFHRNICEVYRVVGRYDDALAAGNKALAMAPNDPTALMNLSLLHYARLELDQAVELSEKAIKLDPKLAAAHFRLAETHLLRGNFERGWEEYEWRYKLPGAGASIIPKTDRPQWAGKELGENRLLLIADKGVGDVLQFCRYIPWAAERAPNLVVACTAELQPFIEQQKGVRHTFVQWEEAQPFVVYCPISGLPRLAGTRLDSIPQEGPYIKADPQRSAAWVERLAALVPGGHKRVGIVWAGSQAHSNDRNRSASLSAFAPFADLPDVALVSLQKGPGEAQIADYSGRAPLINLGPELKDYSDTAAVLDHLDLVVTVDTSVAHLAGAMGRKVWILLPFAPDWRWQLDRTDSPWYPTARLFRQKSPGEWGPVMEEATAALRQET